MSELIQKGNEALVLDNLELALSYYSEALNVDSNSVLALKMRSSCYNKLSKFTEALEDCEAGLKLVLDDSDFLAQKSLSLLRLERYDESLETLDLAKRVIMARPEAERVKSLLNRIDSMAKECIQKGAVRHASKVEPSTSVSQGDVVTSQSSLSKSSLKPKMEWYQTSDIVSFALFLKGVDKDANKEIISIIGKEARITVHLPDGSDYISIMNFHDEVETTPISVTIFPVKIEVKLKKKSSSQYQWPALESSGASGSTPVGVIRSNEPSLSSPPLLVNPPANSISTAARSTTKIDMKKVLEEADSDDEESKSSAHGEEALMKLFQQIYKSGDENTRRAMMKSFQTSGGTVLSTNWKEVSETDYEKDIHAPKGMEVKKF